MRERYGAVSERSLQLRFHTQTAGCSLTAQQPEVNIVRTAIEALAGVLGGTQSLHTNSMDEVLALPTEKAARIALRTQQVLAHEAGVTHVADPLGGSYFVEALTDELERQAEEIFSHLDEIGAGSILEGVYAGIDQGYFQGAIAEAAYVYEQKVSSHRRVVVGVTGYFEGNEEEPPPILQIGNEVEELQNKRLADVRSKRSADGVEAALAEVRATAAVADANLMPAIHRAVLTYATVGEIMGALADVFGRWRETPSI
jgi:methylmalonyl-CoA mutase N-terminal domain/subunit